MAPGGEGDQRFFPDPRDPKRDHPEGSEGGGARENWRTGSENQGGAGSSGYHSHGRYRMESRGKRPFFDDVLQRECGLLSN